MDAEYMSTIEDIRERLEKQIKEGATTVAELSLETNYYDFIKPYVRYVMKMNKNKAKSDIILLYMLVQYTMREYTGTGFHSSFCTSMGCETTNETFIRDVIQETIKDYHLQDFRYFSARNTCVECVKAHSLSYLAKQSDFLDSSKKIYEWLGCNIQDREIVKRELYFIQQKCRRTSPTSNKEEEIEIQFGKGTTGQPAPSLHLIESTLRFFSFVCIDSLMNVYYPILQLIDNWYYPQDEPNQIKPYKIDWILPSFNNWAAAQNDNQTRTAGQRRTSPYRNRSPFFHFNPHVGDDFFTLIIPEITKEASSSDARWFCKIESDGQLISQPFALTISNVLDFDSEIFWKSAKATVSINWEKLFSNISICIYQANDNPNNNDEADDIITEWSISKNLYRLFDINGYQINKIQAGKENILLVAPSSPINCAGIDNIRDNSTIFFDRHQFTASDSAVVQICTDTVVSTSGQFYAEPFFDDAIESIVITKDNRIIPAARKHPKISIRCNRGEEQRIEIKINGIPKRWLNTNQYYTIPDPSNPNGVIVTFSVDQFYADASTEENKSIPEGNVDGVFTVEYGVRGMTKKPLSYVVLQSFAFRFSRPRFYEPNCELKVTRELSLNPQTSDFYTCTSFDSDANSYWQTYNVTIKPDCDGVCFDCQKYNITLTIPVRKAIFWFGNDISEALFFRQQTSIPFTQISSTLNILISGAQNMSLQCNNILCDGNLIDSRKYHYRFDLSAVINSFSDGIPSCITIQYFDTKMRSPYISIHSIFPLKPIECFSLINNTLQYKLDEAPNGASYYIELYADKNNESLIGSIQLVSLGWQEIYTIVKNQTYWYRRKIAVPTALSFLQDNIYYIDKDKMPLIYYDVDNLVGVTMDIWDARRQYQYLYSVRVWKKIGDRYLGTLLADGIPKFTVLLYNLKLENGCLSCQMAAYSKKFNRYYLFQSGRATGKIDLKYNHFNELVAMGSEPNSWTYTFDRNSFRKGEQQNGFQTI